MTGASHVGAKVSRAGFFCLKVIAWLRWTAAEGTALVGWAGGRTQAHTRCASVQPAGT
jgi:hypothetical protein